MFKFGKTSTRRINTCHDDIQHVMRLALFLSTVDFFIAEGSRDKQKQNEYFMTGASKLKYPKSYHNELVSLAADVVPYVNGKAVWSHETDDEKRSWSELIKSIKQAAKILNVPLEWGFDLWKWDRPHWQLTSYRK